MHGGKEVAREHGFDSVEDLLLASISLPQLDVDATKSYLAQSPRGYWFVWDDASLKNRA